MRPAILVVFRTVPYDERTGGIAEYRPTESDEALDPEEFARQVLLPLYLTAKQDAEARLVHGRPVTISKPS